MLSIKFGKNIYSSFIVRFQNFLILLLHNLHSWIAF